MVNRHAVRCAVVVGSTLLLWVVAHVADAAPPEDPEAVAAPVPALLPDEATADPPDWVKPGTQITYHSMAATRQANEDRYVPDPDGEFEAMDGTRYRRVPGGGGGLVGASGQGFLVWDVVAKAGDKMLVEYRLYTLEGLPTPKAVFSRREGMAIDALHGGGLWEHPKLLEQLQPALRQGTRVFKGPYPVGERVYDAVAIGTPDTHSVYDASSGVLLLQSIRTHTDIGSVLLGGRFQPGTGRTGETLTTFRGARQRTLPWAEHPMPPAMQQVKAMRYDGQIVTAVPGGPAVPVPTRMVLRRTAAGPQWATYRAVRETGVPGAGIPMDNEAWGVVAGPSQLGGFFVPPAGLKDLEVGQVLDEDRLVGLKTAVTDISPTAGGSVAVTITEQAGGTVNAWTYDRDTGVQTGWQMWVPDLNLQIAYQLSGYE